MDKGRDNHLAMTECDTCIGLTACPPYWQSFSFKKSLRSDGFETTLWYAHLDNLPGCCPLLIHRVGKDLHTVHSPLQVISFITDSSLTISLCF